MNYSSNSLVTNHVNLALSKNKIFNKISYNKQTLKYLQTLSSLGVVNGLFLKPHKLKHRASLNFSVFFYKNTSFFYKVKHVSTSSKKFYISLKGLKSINTSLKATTLLLSTSKGVITHKAALRYKIGGLILFVIS